MRGALLLTATLVAGMTFPFWNASEILGEDAPPSGKCPFLPAYGAVYEGRDPVVPNSENRADLISRTLDCTMQQMTPTQTQQYRDSVGAVISRDPGVRSAESALLMVELAAAISKSRIARQQVEVARRLFGGISDQQVEDLARSREVLKVLRANGWVGFAQASVAPGHFGDYVDQCKDEGVPIPPPIASGQWTNTKLTTSIPENWLLQTENPEVWTYSNKDGFCVALYRESNSAKAIGTICSDNTQRHACFFDSVGYEDGHTVTLSVEAAKQAEYSSLAHPQDIENYCDECHVGENPFIVNPGAPLGKIVQGLYDWAAVPKLSKFEFEGAALSDWTNPQLLAVDKTAPEGKCVKCHDLPGADTGGYCSTILFPATGLFMPKEWAKVGNFERVEIWPDPETGCPATAQDEIPKELLPYILSVHRLADMCDPEVHYPDCDTGSSSLQ